MRALNNRKKEILGPKENAQHFLWVPEAVRLRLCQACGKEVPEGQGVYNIHIKRGQISSSGLYCKKCWVKK